MSKVLEKILEWLMDLGIIKGDLKNYLEKNKWLSFLVVSFVVIIVLGLVVWFVVNTLIGEAAPSFGAYVLNYMVVALLISNRPVPKPCQPRQDVL